MRFLLWVVLALGVLWGGYWFVASTALERQVNGWFDAQIAEGRAVGREGVGVTGFPNRLDLTVTAPFFVDEVTGIGWKAPFVQVLSMTWKPWHLIGIMAPTQEITLPSGRVVGVTADLQASLQMRPSLDMALNQLVVDGSAIKLSSGDWAMAADRVELAAASDASQPNGLRLGLLAKDVVLDKAVAAAVPALGPTVSDARLDATLALTEPVDRHMTPEVGVAGLRLAEAHLAWGPMVVTAEGEVTRAADGRAEGEIRIAIDDWQSLPDALVALRVMPETMKPWVSRALTLLAAGSEDPHLDVPLTFKDGRMALGALPLGPAPMLPGPAAP